MRSLEITEYVKMLRGLEIRGQTADWAYWMKCWDEYRTDINPNAKWYDENEVNNEKDNHITDIIDDSN